MSNWNKEKKAYRKRRQASLERSLREAVNIEGGVRSKVYQELSEELIKALRHEGRIPVARVMVFAEPVQSAPEGSIDEPDYVLFPFVAQTVNKFAERNLERILTKAMNDWVETAFFDGGEDGLGEVKLVGKL